MDSNHRSPVKDQLVETVLFDFPAEARKRAIGGRRSQPRDLGGDLRRDHNLRDDNDRLGRGRKFVLPPLALKIGLDLRLGRLPNVDHRFALPTSQRLFRCAKERPSFLPPRKR